MEIWSKIMPYYLEFKQKEASQLGEFILIMLTVSVCVFAFPNLM